jgi:cold shock CspA family protein
MRFAGKVSDFNRITGRGLISSKAYGHRIKFRTSQVVGGYGKLDAGDHVEFEVGVVDGVPEALRVSVMSRLAALQQRTAKAHVGKQIEEEKSDVVGQSLTSLAALPEAAPSAPLLSVWPGTLSRPDQASPHLTTACSGQPAGRASR